MVVTHRGCGCYCYATFALGTPRVVCLPAAVGGCTRFRFCFVPRELDRFAEKGLREDFWFGLSRLGDPVGIGSRDVRETDRAPPTEGHSHGAVEALPAQSRIRRAVALSPASGCDGLKTRPAPRDAARPASVAHRFALSRDRLDGLLRADRRGKRKV